MHILQLAGGQVWPNFLPLLGFEIKRVTFLTSSDPEQRYRNSIENMAGTAEKMGASFKVDIISTTSKQPTIQECLRLLENFRFDMINLTGGTKPMCLAAFQHAANHKIPSFYLDTRRTKTPPFENAHSSDAPIKFPDRAPLVSQITVHNALEAQGFPVPAHFKRPDQERLRFSAFAAQIRADQNANQAIAASLGTLRTKLYKNGRFSRKGALRSKLKNPFRAELHTPFHRYLQKAAELGILSSTRSKEEFLLTTLDPVSENADKLKSSAETNFKLLEGVWFELAVYQRLHELRSFPDIAWSVEGDTESRGETDLVAFNEMTLNLHFISCKVSGPHGTPLDHIQGLRQRATKEGGRFSKAELWIFRPRNENHRNDLQRLCEEQDVIFRVYTETVPSGIPTVDVSNPISQSGSQPQ